MPLFRNDPPIQGVLVFKFELLDIDHLIVHYAISKNSITCIKFVLCDRNYEKSDYILGRHKHVVDDLSTHVKMD